MSQRNKTIFLYTIISIVGFIFFFLVEERGYVMGGDSELYINFGHYSGVMPIYPLFIQASRLVFGEGIYLEAIAVIQGVLALVCCLIFVRFLEKRFKLGILDLCIIFLFSLMPYAIEIPGHVISHELMTEGLAYPLFYIYVVILLKAVFERSQKYTLFSALSVLILSLIRPQMQFLFAVTAIIFFYIKIIKRIEAGKNQKSKGILYYGKGLLICIFIILFGIKAVSVVDGWYEGVFFGGHAQDSSNYTIQARVLYAADEEDVDLFEDESLREIYRKTYHTMKEMECTYHTMPNDLWTWKSIVGCSAMNSRIVQGYVEDYLREECGLEDSIVIEETKNQICGEMTDILLKDNWPRYLFQSLKLMPSGLIASVLFQREGMYLLCHIATAVLYVLAFVFIVMFYKRRDLDTRKAELLFLVAGTAIINVVSSNLILFGLQRYMVYTYGMFYVAMYLAVCELWRNRKEVFKKRENTTCDTRI